MPLIKSAIKRMHQNRTRQRRLLPYRSNMKTMTKKVLLLVKEGKKAEAEKVLPEAVRAVDVAVKKNILHPNTGDRKKSRLSRAIASLAK